MKFAIAIVSIFAVASAAITRPDEVLAELDALGETVTARQTSLKQRISELRLRSGEANGQYFEDVYQTVEGNIKNISASDSDIRELLTGESACIVNLKNFIDNILELSGYAISNCIEPTEANKTNVALEAIELLDAFEQEINNLPSIIVDSLIGRNVFTQSAEILAHVQEQLAAKEAEHQEKIDAIAVKTDGVSSGLETGIQNLNLCFGDVDGSIRSGYAAVQMQIPVCQRFGRSGRSAVLRAEDFFPQLRK